MHMSALILVLLSAFLHATWNAQLKSGKNQAQFMASMSLAVGAISLGCVPLVGLPNGRSWPCIAFSGALHILYNFLLLQKYKNADFSSAYPISRGVSPVLVSLGAFLFMHQHLQSLSLIGIALISCGILLLVAGKNGLDLPVMLPAFATGATIAAYTVVDTIGVRRSGSTAAYSVWIFASYVFVPVMLRIFRFRVQLIDQTSMPKAACAGVLSLIAYTVVLWSTHYVPVGTVSALRETSVLWAAVIGRVFLGEKLTRRKICSAVLICCGVCLLVGSTRAKCASETSELKTLRLTIPKAAASRARSMGPDKITTEPRPTEGCMTLLLSPYALRAQTPADLAANEGIWQGYNGEWRYASRLLLSIADAIPAGKYGGTIFFTAQFVHVIDGLVVSHSCQSHSDCRSKLLPAKKATDKVGLLLIHSEVIHAAQSFLVRNFVACCRFHRHASCYANWGFNVWQCNTHQGQLL